MKHDPELSKLLLLNARDGGLEELIAKYPQDLVLEQKARLIDEGLAAGKTIHDGLRPRWVKNFRLTPAGHSHLESLEGSAVSEGRSTKTVLNPAVRVFISHSSADSNVAEAFVELLEKALRLGPAEIRCTSLTGYDLPVGTNIDDRLRFEIERSEILIALITANSLLSTYVLFELGARWILRKPLYPILAKGIKAGMLKEPLKALVASSCDIRDKIVRLLESLGEQLEITLARPSSYEKAVVKLVSVSRSAQTVAPKRGATSEGDTDALELSAYEIFSLQAIGDGCGGPALEEIIADNLGITVARAHQAVESIRRKGLVACRPSAHGDVNYLWTERGRTWLKAHT